MPNFNPKPEHEQGKNHMFEPNDNNPDYRSKQ